MLAFSNPSNSHGNSPISLFSCLQFHWTVKIYFHDFQPLDGMSTIPSTFVSPPTLQKNSSKRLPIQLLLSFLLGVNSRCWKFRSTFVKFLCAMSEKKTFSFQAKSILILTNTISIKCPHLLKLPGQVQVQVVVGAAVQVAVEWILTQKLQRQNGKNYHGWQKFCKSRLVLYFPFTICVNPLRWWFVWMSESFNLKGGARKASYFATVIHDERNQHKSSFGKFRRSLIFTLEVVEIRSLTCLHSLAAYEEPYLAMAEMVGTSPFSNKRHR